MAGEMGAQKWSGSPLPLLSDLKYPCATLFLLAVSAHWFVPITKGLLKVVCSGKDDFKCKDA